MHNSRCDQFGKTSGIFTLNKDYGCGYYKNGNTVYLVCDFGNKNVPQSGVTLGTLGSSYRPSCNIYARNAFDNQNGQLIISIDGSVKLNSSVGAFTYGHFSCCFPASSNYS